MGVLLGLVGRGDRTGLFAHGEFAGSAVPRDFKTEFHQILDDDIGVAVDVVGADRVVVDVGDDVRVEDPADRVARLRRGRRQDERTDSEHGGEEQRKSFLHEESPFG